MAIKKTHLRSLVMLPLPSRFHSAEAVCLHSGVNSLASTKHMGRTTFQCKFVSVLVFFIYNYNIIYEQQINILLFLFIFRFTNIEIALVITLTFKSLMKILLFQWSQLSKHLDWRPYIDAWSRRLQVSHPTSRRP